MVSNVGLRRLDLSFEKALKSARPSETIAYFYPDPPRHLVELARDRGITTIREMINTACATAGPILDEAYRRHGRVPDHPVTEAKIRAESAELRLYDYIFANNAEVERSLQSLGIAREKIVSTSFGWSRERFAGGRPNGSDNRPLRFLFVGTLNIRKGVPELLAAWQQADPDGELILAGHIDGQVAELVSKSRDGSRIRTIEYTEDVEGLFRDSDVFVFPSLEEGGPQVTYEAAGCGLPLITTPMGAGRIAREGRTALTVAPGNVDELAAAIGTLAADRQLREDLGCQAEALAQDYTYQRVAEQRYAFMCGLLDS